MNESLGAKIAKEMVKPKGGFVVEEMGELKKDSPLGER